MDYKVISFYKYVKIKDVEGLKKNIQESCVSLEILGRILIAEEGINGAVCGRIKDIESFKKLLQKDSLVNGLTFREQECGSNVYHKLVVRSRKEIVVLGRDVDLKNTGKHLTPREFKKLLDYKKDVVILDARNNYEFSVGRFKNAIHLDIEAFKEFPGKINKIKDIKDKKIVMYCTGGIRCEKASALMKKEGFKDVSQLQGGIINYVNEFPNTYFDGACFVFDDRLTAHSGDPVSICEICDNPCDMYLNCHNLDCDKLFICCNSCREKMNKCCSEECKNSPRQRKEDKKLNVVGKVENYYPKIKVALVKLDKPVEMNSRICFVGNTTSFEQEIKEMRNFDDGLATISVLDKVRRNDKICLS